MKGRTDNSKKLVKHNQVGREEFTSNKLAPKLAQQLKVHLPTRHKLNDTDCTAHSLQLLCTYTGDWAFVMNFLSCVPVNCVPNVGVSTVPRRF